jgi:hypothetical protein
MLFLKGSGKSYPYSKTDSEYGQKTKADKIFKTSQTLQVALHMPHRLIHKFGINFPPFRPL